MFLNNPFTSQLVNFFYCKIIYFCCCCYCCEKYCNFFKSYNRPTHLALPQQQESSQMVYMSTTNNCLNNVESNNNSRLTQQIEQVKFGVLL